VLLLGYTALVVALCALASRSLIGLFTTDQEAIFCGALLLSRECWTFPVANLRHLQEARLRGRKKMTLYLASSTAALTSNILACLALVPRVGFPGFYLATYISTPLGLLFSTALGAWPPPLCLSKKRQRRFFEKGGRARGKELAGKQVLIRRDSL